MVTMLWLQKHVNMNMVTMLWLQLLISIYKVVTKKQKCELDVFFLSYKSVN